MSRVTGRTTARQAWEILEAALEILRLDAAPAYFRIVACLNDMRVKLDIDAETFGVHASAEGIVVVRDWQVDCWHAEVITQRRVVLELIDGHTSFLEAVMSRRLFLQAPLDMMNRLARTLDAFVEGSVRSRRMRALLEDFRNET